ncbi:hypothetical protein [Kribbella deserti]|uniref:Uncharacterized protein n=1 Tax=Kribbella deserti TaxID=1926257 RepID=A0ABV6QLU8_9ACTN
MRVDLDIAGGHAAGLVDSGAAAVDVRPDHVVRDVLKAFEFIRAS